MQYSVRTAWRYCRGAHSCQKQKYDTPKTPLAVNCALVPKGQKPSAAMLHRWVTGDPFMVGIVIVSRCYLHTKQM